MCLSIKVISNCSVIIIAKFTFILTMSGDLPPIYKEESFLTTRPSASPLIIPAKQVLKCDLDLHFCCVAIY